MSGSKRGGRQLVLQHLEGSHHELFESHQPVLREFLKGRHGVYALYKGERLYYVGLATNLRTRLRQHLRDRHQGKWDRFSLYITSSEKSLRELEALVIRIVRPEGNRMKMRLPGSQDLRREVGRAIKRRQMDERVRLIGASSYHKARERKAERTAGGPRRSRLTDKSLRMMMMYKGKRYGATLLPSGEVRYDGRVYNSPTAALQQIRPATNAGHLWYARRDGEWVRLKELGGARTRKQSAKKK